MPEPQVDPVHTRTAIIGGGVSGITAAYRLHKNGYRNVTLYEGNAQIGGKVRTFEIDGQIIELGAVATMNDNSTVFDIGRELGVLTVRKMRAKPMVLWTKRDGLKEKVSIDRYWRECSHVALARGLFQLERTLRSRKFQPVFKPGFHDLHPDLVNLSMTAFARKYAFDEILEPFYAAMYAFGYGALSDSAALYSLKFIRSLARRSLRHLMSFGRDPGIYTFVPGFQRFWEMVGAHLESNGIELRLGGSVTRVVRRAVDDGRAEIAVTAEGETLTYDRLLVTCVPEQFLKFMDATNEEKDLFQRVSYFNHHAVIFRAEGMREGEMVALRDNMERHRQGHLFGYMSDWPGSNLFVGYQFNHTGESEAELDELIWRDISELGGAVTEIILRAPWRYFPHVQVEDLGLQYYPRVNALQGQNGTYYLGSLFAFESVDHCAEFASFVVDKYISPHALTDRADAVERFDSTDRPPWYGSS